MIKARYYERLDNNQVKCLLCPNYCVIDKNCRGVCKARSNKEKDLFSDVYGKISSLTLDPIEKKPLYRFYPGTTVLSFGSYGCNFSCSFCQNYEISQTIPQDYKKIADYEPCNIAEMAISLKDKNCIGVAYTYNEPITNYEFVLDTARIVNQYDLKNVIVTNGYINKEPLLELIPYIDAFNIDLKDFNNNIYRKIGGNLELVKQNIDNIYKYCHLEVTTPIIPNENDKQDEIDALAKWLASVDKSIPLHLTRFFPRYRYLKYAPTSVSVLNELAEVARQHLKYVYVGNV